MWVARLAIPLTVAAAAPAVSSIHQDLFALLQSKLREDDGLSASEGALQKARLGVKELLTNFVSLGVETQVNMLSVEFQDAAQRESWIDSFEGLMEMIPGDTQDMERAIDGAQEALDGPVTKSFLNGAFAEYFEDSMPNIRDALDKSKSQLQLPNVRSALVKEAQDTIKGFKNIDLRSKIEGLADENNLRRAVIGLKDAFAEFTQTRNVEPIVLAQMGDDEDHFPKPKPPRTDFNGYKPNSDPDSFRYVPTMMSRNAQVFWYSVIGFFVGSHQGNLALKAFYEYLRHDEDYKSKIAFLIVSHQVVDTFLGYVSSRYFVLGEGGAKDKLWPGQAAVADRNSLTYTKKYDVDPYSADITNRAHNAWSAVTQGALLLYYLSNSTHSAVTDAQKTEATTLYEMLRKSTGNVPDMIPELWVNAIRNNSEVKKGFKKRFEELKKSYVGGTTTFDNHPATPPADWPEYTDGASKLIISANIDFLEEMENKEIYIPRMKALLDTLPANAIIAAGNSAWTWWSENRAVTKKKKQDGPLIDDTYFGGLLAEDLDPEGARARKDEALRKLGIKRPLVPAVGLDDQTQSKDTCCRRQPRQQYQIFFNSQIFDAPC